MSNDKYWERIAPRLRRYLGLTPPTLEEAEKAIQEAKPEPMTESQIQSIIDYAKTGRKTT